MTDAIQNDLIELCDLVTDSSLIDSNFDGYKLALDKLPVKELRYGPGVLVHQLSDKQFSIQHSKIFTYAKSFFFDPWTSNEDQQTFLFVQKDGYAYKAQFDLKADRWLELEKLGIATPAEIPGDAMPISVVFLSSDLAIFSRGIGDISIVSTEVNRSAWRTQHTLEPTDGQHYLVEGRLREKEIHILLETVKEHVKESDSDKGVFDHLLIWIVLAADTYEQIAKHELKLAGITESITLDDNCKNLILMGSKPPVDLNEPSESVEQAGCVSKTEKRETESGQKEASAPMPLYLWTESADSITVVVSLDFTLTKDEVHLETTSDTISLKCKDNTIFNGSLGGRIIPADTIWTLSGSSSIEITLFKLMHNEKWEQLILGDSRGRRENVDTSAGGAAEELLKRFTEATRAIGGQGSAENFNMEQLEECDMGDDDMMFVFWWDREKQKVVRQCDITGHLHLFDTRNDGESALLCLRHDVDGLLFSVGDNRLRHLATFNALGYIQASKTRKRFTACPPRRSYVAIAEANNHVYIYLQPNALSSDLRNRKTNEVVSHVSKQLIFSLKQRADDTTEQRALEILTVHAADRYLFIFTADTFYAICI